MLLDISCHSPFSSNQITIYIYGVIWQNRANCAQPNCLQTWNCLYVIICYNEDKQADNTFPLNVQYNTQYAIKQNNSITAIKIVIVIYYLHEKQIEGSSNLSFVSVTIVVNIKQWNLVTSTTFYCTLWASISGCISLLMP